MPLKTADLPVGERPPMVYKLTAQSFELRTTQSGNPMINVTLLRTNGGKRFDNINLKSRWFEPDFDASKITDPKERTNFYISVGKQGRDGKLMTYLGQDFKGEFNSPEEAVQVLTGKSVGTQYWAVETQRKDSETGVPTERYNLRLYHEPPRKLPKGAIWLDELPAVEEGK